MSFTSYQFLVFFPVVTGLYFLLPHRFRWALLLIASCIFYAAFVPSYLLILFALIIIDYCVGIKIEGSTGNARKGWLTVSVISTCIALFAFKYFNFFASNINAVAQFLHIPSSLPILKIILPIGLSFHTFQSLSYIFEIYYGRFRAERHIGIYALYVMFYPQLVAGPIERPQNLLHQFREEHTFDLFRLSDGLKRIMIGFFKKIVIADNLAIYVNQVYTQPSSSPGYVLIIATLFFAIQIYCDFSGYSDIALGSAQSMGFTLMENFKNPYSANSLNDFWRRWHVSLSTWFRDYVYIPLGGNRVNSLRWAFNICITFTLSGLWHGANWTYILWGSLHGSYLVLEKAVDSFVLPRLRTATSFFADLFYGIKRILGLGIVLLSWAFFRALNVSDALFIAKHSVTDTFMLIGKFFTGNPSFLLGHVVHQILLPLRLLNMGRKQFLLYLILLLLFVILEEIDKKTGIVYWINSLHIGIRWALYAVIILIILNLGATNELPFIYFQF